MSEYALFGVRQVSAAWIDRAGGKYKVTKGERGTNLEPQCNVSAWRLLIEEAVLQVSVA